MSALIQRVWWAANGITEPHPIGDGHIHTASSACFTGRHWNCGLKVVHLRGTRPCTCPCHEGGAR